MKLEAGGQQQNAVLSSRLRYQDRTLLWGRIQLYRDRIEIKGFGWTGWHSRTIQLTEVEMIDWRAGDRFNLDVLLYGGTLLTVGVNGAGLWKYQVEELAPNIKRATHPAPERLESAA